jgi:hypothetical protein
MNASLRCRSHMYSLLGASLVPRVSPTTCLHRGAADWRQSGMEISLCKPTRLCACQIAQARQAEESWS